MTNQIRQHPQHPPVPDAAGCWLQPGVSAGSVSVTETSPHISLASLRQLSSSSSSSSSDSSQQLSLPPLLVPYCWSQTGEAVIFSCHHYHHNHHSNIPKTAGCLSQPGKLTTGVLITNQWLSHTYYQVFRSPAHHHHTHITNPLPSHILSGVLITNPSPTHTYHQPITITYISSGVLITNPSLTHTF